MHIITHTPPTQELVEGLPPLRQYLHQKRTELRSGALGEQLQAIKAMGGWAAPGALHLLGLGGAPA